MSSYSQTISKQKYLLILATFPFLASDCSSFPLHFQLACNCTAGVPIIHHRRAGTKSGKWGGSFLRHLCCGWDGIFLSAAFCLKTSTFSCMYPADFRLCSSCVGCRQPFLMGFLFKIDYWLCLQGNQPHVSLYKHHYKSKACLLLFSYLDQNIPLQWKLLYIFLSVCEILSVQIVLLDNALLHLCYQYNYVSRSVCRGLSI